MTTIKNENTATQIDYSKPIGLGSFPNLSLRDVFFNKTSQTKLSSKTTKESPKKEESSS